MANVLSNIVDHPKTSIAGLLIGIVTIGGVLSQQGITLGSAGKGTVVALVAGIASALLGLLAKDPGAQTPPGTNGTAKLGVLMLVSIVLMGSMVGCTGPQVAQNIVNWTPTIISTANEVGAVVSVLDPASAVVIGPAVAGFDAVAQTVANQAQAYLDHPTVTALQALQVQVAAFQQSVSKAVLESLKIVNPASQQQVLVAIQALSVGVNAVLALIASIKGNTVAAAHDAVKVAQLEPYLDRKQVVAMVAAHYDESDAEASLQVDWSEGKLAAAGF